MSTHAARKEVVLSLYFLNPKFQTSSHLLWLYSTFVSHLVVNQEGRLSCDAALSIKVSDLKNLLFALP